MLHELLSKYRCYLELKYSFETARTYTIRLGTLFEGQNPMTVDKVLDPDKILANLSAIKHKNHFSQTKNAFLHYCEFKNITLSEEILDRIQAIEKGTHKKYKHLKTVDYRDVEKKIKALRNKKLRLCFQLMVATGLRVSELAGITTSDCVVSEQAITLYFTAKGGVREQVILNKSEYSVLYQSIQELWDNALPDKKLFYSVVYLQGKAKELGFTCHDLRRACAKLEYQKSHSKTEVMEKLRHSSLKNTNIYLRSRVNI